MKRIKRPKHLLAAIIIFFAVALILSSAVLIYQGQRTLTILSHPQGVRSLTIYSRWLILDPVRYSSSTGPAAMNSSAAGLTLY